jgi:hypothetical protein
MMVNDLLAFLCGAMLDTYEGRAEAMAAHGPWRVAVDAAWVDQNEPSVTRTIEPEGSGSFDATRTAAPGPVSTTGPQPVDTRHHQQGQ